MSANESIIVILDDSELVRRKLAHDLRDSGYRFLEMADAASFHAFLNNPDSYTDMFLIDLLLPDGHGLELLREVRQNENFVNTPLFIITGEESQSQIDACFKAGADDCIQKPWSVIELNSCVRSHLARWHASRELIKAKVEWERTFDAVPDLIAILDLNQRIVQANQALAERMGLTPRECVGKECFTLFHKTSSPVAECPFSQARDGHSVNTKAIYEPLLDAYFDVSVSPIADEDGSIVGVVHVARDVTEQTNLRKNLARSEEVLNRTQGLAKVGGWDLDLETNELFWTDQNWEIFELPPDHVPDVDSTIEYYVPEVRDEVRATVTAAIEDRQPFDCEWPARTAKGRPIWLRANGQADYDGDRPVRLYGSVQDVTQRKELEAQLTYDATHDRMTGIFNRATVLEQLHSHMSHAKRYGEKMSFCLADLDHFKQVNDNFGHQAGDDVLVRFARLLKKTIRDGDYVGRYGGEEFALILPHTDCKAARKCLERGLEMLRNETFENRNGQEFSVTATFGIATLKADMDIDSLIATADRMLYHGKENGRNGVWCPCDLEKETSG